MYIVEWCDHEGNQQQREFDNLEWRFNHDKKGTLQDFPPSVHPGHVSFSGTGPGRFMPGDRRTSKSHRRGFEGYPHLMMARWFRAETAPRRCRGKPQSTLKINILTRKRG